jgi:hypothetical protein
VTKTARLFPAITGASFIKGAAAALCCVIPYVTSGQGIPAADVMYVARTSGADCPQVAGMVSIQTGAGVEVHPAVPGAAIAPVLLKQRFIRTQSDTLKTGAPYSAIGTTQMVQTLPDGNRIVHTNTSHYYRDGSGRMRTEMSLSAVGPFTLDESRTVVMINDPVAKQRIVLHPEQKRAEVLPFAMAGADKQSAGPGAATTSTKEDAPTVSAAPALAPIQCMPGSTSTPPTTVSLGQKTVAGLPATGTRVEYTIPAGQIGNEGPITVTSEQWVSNDLGVIVSSTQQDPLVGDTTFQLSQIQRAEPDPSLFVVPANYAVTNVTANRQVIMQLRDPP